MYKILFLFAFIIGCFVLGILMARNDKPEPATAWRVLELRDTAHVGAKPLVIEERRYTVKLLTSCLRVREYCSGGTITGCKGGVTITPYGRFSGDATRESWVMPGKVVYSLEEAMTYCEAER